MIDMAHDGHHGRTPLHFSGLVLLHFQDGLLFEGRLFHTVAELGGDQDRRIVVDGLG